MSFKTDVSTALRSCLAAMGFTASRPPVGLGSALRILSLVLLTLTVTQAAAEDDRKLGQNFPFAYALRGCTQEDAPALEIYLTQVAFNGEGTPPAPYLRIEIASPPTETIGPLTLQLIPLRRDPAKPGRIVRAELMESGHKSTWLSGTIALNEATPGGRASGRYDFTSPAGLTLSQNFTAEYSKRPTVCG
jgi:hypothetical protein